jgi:hypothetical protein
MWLLMPVVIRPNVISPSRLKVRTLLLHKYPLTH